MIISKKDRLALHQRDLIEYNKAFAEKDNRKLKFHDRIKKLFFMLLSGKSSWTPPTTKLDGSKIKNIAVMRYDAIGDYFVTTGAIRWLRKAIPEARIDVITSNRNNSIVSEDPFVDNALPLKFASNFDTSMFSIKKYGRETKYDLVVALVYSKSTKSAIMASLLSKTAEKISVFHYKRFKIYGLVFNYQPDVALPGLSWAEKMTKCVVDSIEPVNPVSPADGQPYVFIKKKNYESVRLILDEFNLKYQLNLENVFLESAFETSRDGSPYTIINIAGTEPNRVWGSENCIDFCVKFLDKYKDKYIFISGGPEESERIADIIKLVNNDRCHAYKSSLLDFIAFTAGAELVITPDTGVTHFAAAAKRPVIVMFADESKVLTWFPHNTRSVLLLTPDSTTINKITTDELLQAAHKLFNNEED